MAGSRSISEIQVKVTADAKSAVSGLKPLESSLNDIKDTSLDADKALKELGDRHEIDIDDDAIDRVKREIRLLREQMREDLRMDVDADTREAQRKIRSLRTIVRELEREDIDLDVDVDTTDLTRLHSSFGGIATVGSRLPGVLRVIGSAAGAVTLGLSGIAVAGGAVVLESLKLSDQLANAKIAFAQFLGSGKAAEDFLDRLQTFAAKTPFEFPELVESSKTLLAFGIGTADIIPLMTTLGDAAALTGTQVEELTTIWGQMQAKGKVANEELLQLTEHGIPAYKLLADALGVSVAQVQDMAEKGQLLSDDVLPVLQQRMDDTFGGGMAKQAETLSGLFSTMKDSLGQVGTKLGEAFTPVVAEQIENVTAGLEEFSDWASENKSFLVESFGILASAALNWAADMTAAFQGIVLSAASLFDTFAEMKDIIKIIAPATWFAIRDIDLEGAADSLRTVAGGLGDVSGGLRTAADEALTTSRTWAESFKQSDQIAKFSNDIDDVKDKIADLRKRPPSPEVKLKIHKAQEELTKLRAQRKEFEQEGKVPELDLKIDKGEKRVKNITDSIQYLKTLKPSPKVDLELKEWRKKRKIINDDIKEWTGQKTNIEFGATATADDRRQTTADLDEVADPRDAIINAYVDPFGLNAATKQLDDAAKDRIVNFYINPLGGVPGTSTPGAGNPPTPPRSPAQVEGSAGVPRPARPRRDDNIDVSVYMDGRLVDRVPGRVHRGGRRVA